MAGIRKPYLGVWNIIRFNRHFYIFYFLVVILLFVTLRLLWGGSLAAWICILISLPVAISLLISHWVYDRSDLYQLFWLDTLGIKPGDTLVNINAGFDETSETIAQKYPEARMEVFDFYNETRHTEPSIRRARRAYPPYPGTRIISTSKIPLDDHVADFVFLILSAHEIRKEQERLEFFREVRRVIKPMGRVVVVEHPRDGANFLAYTIGAFHFFSKNNWMIVFREAGFKIEKVIKTTPFISTFIVKCNGTTP